MLGESAKWTYLIRLATDWIVRIPHRCDTKFASLRRFGSNLMNQVSDLLDSDSNFGASYSCANGHFMAVGIYPECDRQQVGKL